MPQPDPAPVRSADFYDRAGDSLTCRECGAIFAIDSAWQDKRIGDVVPCRGCGLGSRIPREESG